MSILKDILYKVAILAVKGPTDIVVNKVEVLKRKKNKMFSYFCTNSNFIDE